MYLASIGSMWFLPGAALTDGTLRLSLWHRSCSSAPFNKEGTQTQTNNGQFANGCECFDSICIDSGYFHVHNFQQIIIANPNLPQCLPMSTRTLFLSQTLVSPCETDLVNAAIISSSDITALKANPTPRQRTITDFRPKTATIRRVPHCARMPENTVNLKDAQENVSDNKFKTSSLRCARSSHGVPCHLRPIQLPQYRILYRARTRRKQHQRRTKRARPHRIRMRSRDFQKQRSEKDASTNTESRGSDARNKRGKDGDPPSSVDRPDSFLPSPVAADDDPKDAENDQKGYW